MSTEPKDGGSAFPRLVSGASNESRFVGSRDLNFKSAGGMTLRDWFAGQALMGLLVAHPASEWKCGALASVAYSAADAMLAERLR